MRLNDGEQQVRSVRVLVLPAEDVALLQACVGFHAKALSDPSVGDRLYRLWCTLEGADRTMHGPLIVPITS